MIETFNPSFPLNFSSRAQEKIAELLLLNNQRALRIYIEGGGCSGFQYRFDLVDRVQEDDIVMDDGKFSVVVDPMSIQYLTNSEVEYREDLMGSQFIITNPQARTTCGCGLSFSI